VIRRGEVEGSSWVERGRFDAALHELRLVGFPVVEDADRAWSDFLALHARYENEVAWLATLLRDSTPAWPDFSAGSSVPATVSKDPRA
jgi:hypothetical protein